MRVAVLLEQCLAPVPGGTGRYARELARALAATGADGATVTGWTGWHRDLGAARVAGVRGPHRLALPRRALAAAWSRGVGPAPRGADVVHAPTLLLPPRRGTPLVVTVHDAVPWTHPQTLTAHGAAWHRRMAARAARTADAVVVPTEAVRRSLAGVLDVAGRLHVVGGGVSPDLAVPPDAEARRRALGLPPRYLVTLATWEPRKGLDLLVAALPALDVPLVVVGQPGWGGVDPAAAADRLPAGRLVVLGRRPDPDLAAVVSGALALVAPSRAEGFGLPVLEAMALGTPVVSSDDPALAEVGGEATVQVPVGDVDALVAALRSVLADDAQRQRLCDAGRRRAAAYTWQRTAASMWRLYATVTGRTGVR